MSYSEDARYHVARSRQAMKGWEQLVKKLEKPLTNPNWDHECRLLVGQSQSVRKALLSLEQALGSPKPARAASAKGGAVKDPKGA